MFKRFAILASLLFVSSAFAVEWQAVEATTGENCCDSPVSTPNPAPGNMGPNAFYFMWHLDDARVVGDQILINLHYRPSLDLRHEWTNATVVSVVVPFSEFASVEFSEIVDRWKLNDRGMADYGARTRTGTTLGDFVATVKFNILKETDARPAITLKGVIKSANGGAEDGRNTDSAGYEIGALFAKDVLKASGALTKIRVLAEIGFFAWDDGIHHQNDAYRYGVATEFLFKRDATLAVGYHAFTGWQKNGDAPKTLYVEGRKVFTPRLTGFTSIDLGLNSKSNPSTNPVLFNAGIRVSLNRPYPKRRR